MDLDALFAVPPKDFIKQRDALGAKGLKRPTVSVWLVNFLYRHEKKTFSELLGAGKKMRDAQAKGRDAVDAAKKAQNALLDTLLRAGEKAATDAGESFTAATKQRVETTLRALSTIGSFAPEEPGRLTADREPVGFEAAFAGPIAKVVPVLEPKPKPMKAPPPPPKPKGPSKADLAAQKNAQAERARLQARIKMLEEKRAEIDAELARLRTHLS